MQVPAPFEYERATSVDHAIGLLERLGERGPADRRRPQPAPDDEAAPGQPRVRHRHQRPPRGARLRAGRADRGAHRRDDPAPRAAGVAGARGALPDLRRRRGGDRRPGGPQPRHHRRLPVPGGPLRGPDRGLHRARRQLRDPRGRRASGWSPWRTSTAAPTRPRSSTTRCSPRSGSRCGRTAPAPTPRSSAGPATGRSPRPGPRSGWTAAHLRCAGRARRGRARTRPGCPAISEALRGQAPSDELYARAGAIAAEGCSPVTDNRGHRRLQAPPRRRADPAHPAHGGRTDPSRHRRRRQGRNG